MDSTGFVKEEAAVDGRSTRWRQHKKARRSQIVDAAMRTIRRRGPTASMNDVAAEAQVSKPVLYRHFGDQAELHRAVGRRVADWLVGSLTAQLHTESEPRQVVAAVVDAYLEIIETEPQLYRFVIGHAFADRHGAESVDGYRETVAVHVADVLRAQLDDHANIVDAWARGLTGLVQNVGDWWLDHPNAATRAQLTEQLTTMIWDGLAQSSQR